MAKVVVNRTQSNPIVVEKRQSSAVEIKPAALQVSIPFEVVATLPSVGTINKVYLVPSVNPSEKNTKDEYTYVNGAWEKIGSTSIDLSNYYTKTVSDNRYVLNSSIAYKSSVTNKTFSTGVLTDAKGYASFATNNESVASGENSFACGYKTTASGNQSHSEGNQTIASAAQAHAEGWGTQATNNGAHAEGDETVASGRYSHAEGESTEAKGNYSHAAGYGTIAAQIAQTTIGKFNVEDTTNRYAFIVGNGTSKTNRKNAFAIKWDGTIVVWNSNNEAVEMSPDKFAELINL